MTKEQFDKATELNQKIEEYTAILKGIRLSISAKEKIDTCESARKNLARWQLSNFFLLTIFRRKVILSPYHDFKQEIVMDADSELIGVIVDYLEKKKRECEAEFEQIGVAENEGTSL